MSKKNARILGVRLDATDADRVEKFEQSTHIEGVSLARAALKGALNEFERTGKLSLPLRIVEAKQPQFSITQLIGPDAQSKASLIEKQDTDLAESKECAANATSNSNSPGSPPIPATRASTVPLPPPPMRTTSATPQQSIAAEEPTPYQTTRKKSLPKNGTED